jgi:hypothetical protein
MVYTRRDYIRDVGLRHYLCERLFDHWWGKQIKMRKTGKYWRKCRICGCVRGTAIKEMLKNR